MRAQRRDSYGSSSEASSINDIRVDLESEDEELAVSNPYEDVSYICTCHLISYYITKSKDFTRLCGDCTLLFFCSVQDLQ